MNFKPLGNYVLLKRIDPASKTAGGIIIPETAQEKSAEGVVEATGQGYIDEWGHKRIPAVSIGDKVAFPKWGGTEITLDGIDYLLVKETELFGVTQSSYVDDKPF